MKKLLVTIIFLSMAASCEAASLYDKLQGRMGLQYWLKILHYKPNFWGHYKSITDSPNFFLDKNGKYNPEAEFYASIKAFKDGKPLVGTLKLHPQCAFPERYRFLKEIGLLNTMDAPCKDFKEWKKGINAESISLVFSTSFPNNPASLFGHTFIRINQKGKKSDLLDYAATYGANTSEEGSKFRYVFYGLFGGYKGYFNFMPYYQKVNEYNNSESRDIYEYKLNLEPDGVDRIVNHLWELYTTAWFDYYFLDENCSLILGGVLELGRDEWNLTKKDKWYYLPADLIKLIAKTKGAVDEVGFRPSIGRRLDWRLSSLNSGEKKLFSAVKSGDVISEQIGNTKVLDALIVYFDFLKHKEFGVLRPKHKKIYHQVLLRRSKFKDGTAIKKDWKRDNKPDLGHGPQKFSLIAGAVNDSSVAGIHFKFGYHDLLDNDKGYEPFSGLDFAEIGVEYNYDLKELDISHIGVINIFSLHPMNFYDPRFSWQVGLNQLFAGEIDGMGKTKWRADGGAGATFNLGSDYFRWYFMFGAVAETSKHFENSWRLGPKVDTGLLMNPTEKYKLTLTGRVIGDVIRRIKKDYYGEAVLGQSLWIKRNQELRLNVAYVSRFGSFDRSTYSARFGWNFCF